MTAATKLRHLLLGRKATKTLNSILKSREDHFSSKVLHSQSYGFSSSHVQIWEIDLKECWTLKNWRFWTMVLRVPWTARRSNQSVLKEIKPEYSLEGMTLELKRQYFGHLMQRANSLEKLLITGKDLGQKEDETVGWYHGLNRNEFEQTPGDSERQGSLACYSPWGGKELDMSITWLNKYHYHQSVDKNPETQRNYVIYQRSHS